MKGTVMPNEQVYYVLANPPTQPQEREHRRSGNRGLLTLAVIGVGAYLLYQNEKKRQELFEEQRKQQQNANAYKTTI
jgi:hypothetical protein